MVPATKRLRISGEPIAADESEAKFKTLIVVAYYFRKNMRDSAGVQ